MTRTEMIAAIERNGLALYVYDNGQSRVTFERGDSRDWYVWSLRRSQRLATYTTRRELLDAYERSENADGAYGLALLNL